MATQTSNRPTIYDVADEAGVSIATVSRVLNASKQVSQPTREKVTSAVNALNYHPNRAAKSLAQRSTRTVTVAAPSFTTPFHNELLKGVRDRLDAEDDVDLLLCDLDWEAPQASLQKFLSQGTLEGLLLVGVPVDEAMAEELLRMGAPVVLVGATWPGLDSYHWDDVEGAEQGTAHLIRQGHRRIGLISTPHDTPVREARTSGYRRALAGAGIPFDPSLVVNGVSKTGSDSRTGPCSLENGTASEDANSAGGHGYTEEAGHASMKHLLRSAPAVTAVFASSDVQAIGAWQALREAGRRVPDDCALVGYDDLKVSRFLGLTSVAQEMQQVGMSATDRLLHRLHGTAKEAVSTVVQPQLQVRTSSLAAGREEEAA